MLKFATGRSLSVGGDHDTKVEFIVGSGKKGVFYKVSMSRLRNPNSDTGLVVTCIQTPSTGYSWLLVA